MQQLLLFFHYHTLIYYYYLKMTLRIQEKLFLTSTPITIKNKFNYFTKQNLDKCIHDK